MQILFIVNDEYRVVSTGNYLNKKKQNKPFKSLLICIQVYFNGSFAQKYVSPSINILEIVKLNIILHACIRVVVDLS